MVFNPGLNIAATNYQGSLRHLASWCYAVVANGTTYSPLSVDDAAWTQDVQDMLAWVSSPTEPQVAGRFGPQRALIGHSAGAKNSLRAAGAQPAHVRGKRTNQRGVARKADGPAEVPARPRR